jgi:hypothetical protein
LDTTYTFGGDSIRFWGPEPLDSTDLLVLQGLAALATNCGEKKRAMMLYDSAKADALRLPFLDLKWDAIESDTMVAKGNISQLCRELGYSTYGGTEFKTIRGSIERLWSVSVIVESEGCRQGFRILADYASKEKEGKIYVALNPRLTEAILGRRPHTHINMDEIRAIKSGPTRLLHQRLCGWIDLNTARLVTLDTMRSYIWPYESVNPNTIKSHNRIARKSLAELAAIGWLVNEYSKGKFEIGRPAHNF